ncbi:nitrogenase-stabilizing/protective protein NifW [Acidiferrobacter sp.]|uniref:nitrogenase-stabilizing/protective protein NifW n=1 Tax=Acidiferrobacter sp. TaxID=1872107 RepID=UPI00260C7E45|nr:nitrogenase-stabilizing/protective protein NifW [Acidiferrobacter sp.]
MNDRLQDSPSRKLFRDLGLLSAAEEFFEYLAVPYDSHVVNVNRLHILKRFRQYLATALDQAPEDGTALRALCASLLAKAHEDFARSSAQAEKVFRVFQGQMPEIAVTAIKQTCASRPKGG